MMQRLFHYLHGISNDFHSEIITANQKKPGDLPGEKN
jgi:hypothetical protein